MEPFSVRVIDIIKNIPPGTVLSYGEIAALAGNPRAARQVSRILHSCSGKYDLPWHRVVGSGRKISLLPGKGFEEQSALLRNEGLEITESGRIL